MNKIFWGLIFLFFNINLGNINILPTFLGYILIFLGLNELGGKYGGEELYAVEENAPWPVAGAILSGLFWLPLIDLSGSFWLSFLVSLAGLVIQLRVTYLVLEAVEEIEKRRSAQLNSAFMRKSWTVMAVGTSASVLLSVLDSILAVAVLVVGLVSAVVFIVVFYQSKKALEQLPPSAGV